jgi:hypothetical protein
MIGKYISPFFDGVKEKWVVSKEPVRSATASGYGKPDEWEVLFDISAGAWIPVTEKVLEINDVPYVPTRTEIADVNIIGPYVDFVIKYTNETTQAMYFHERMLDSYFRSANYSIGNADNYQKSIVGDFRNDPFRVIQFNGSVMLHDHIRMNTLLDQAVTFGYTESPVQAGVILAPYGGLKENTLIDKYTEGEDQYLIYTDSNGAKIVMCLSSKIENRIERIGQYISKINTVDVKNLMVEYEGNIIQLENGSIDWNNKFEIISNIKDAGVYPLTTYHVNSAYNPNYEITGKRSCSLVADDVVFTLYGELSILTDIGKYGIKLQHNVFNDIDVFWDTESPAIYKYSANGDTIYEKSALGGIAFPNGVIVPFPVGTEWPIQNDIQAIGYMQSNTMGQGLLLENRTMEIYMYNAQVYYGSSSFVLYGIQYVFDGDYIYTALGMERIAMAFGYQFLGCDNSSAYFYSLWDKGVYSFNGARDLQKIINLSNRKEIKSGRYDSYSGEMIITARGEILKIRENIIMNFPAEPGNIIIPTKKGPYIQLTDGSFIKHQPQGESIDEFNLETEYLGVDGSTVCDYERMDIRLHSTEKNAVKLEIGVKTINQDTKESEARTVNVLARDWSEDGYKTIRITPKYKKGTGAALSIRSLDLIQVVNIEFTYEALGRTANSRNNGV